MAEQISAAGLNQTNYSKQRSNGFGGMFYV